MRPFAGRYGLQHTLAVATVSAGVGFAIQSRLPEPKAALSIAVELSPAYPMMLVLVLMGTLVKFERATLFHRGTPERAILLHATTIACVSVAARVLHSVLTNAPYYVHHIAVGELWFYPVVIVQLLVATTMFSLLAGAAWWVSNWRRPFQDDRLSVDKAKHSPRG